MKNAWLAASLLVATLGLAQCTPTAGSDKLPVLGPKEITQRVEGTKTITDTVFHTIPDFRFANQDSAIITPGSLQGKVYVADFFFTSCPTICPIMKTEMKRVYDEFHKDPNFAIVSHSIDPTYDTVALLHDYAERLGVSSKTWHFLTGDMADIHAIAQRGYMVTAMEDDAAPGGYLHSGAFVLVDPEGRIRGRLYDGTKTDDVTQLMADIRRLMAEYFRPPNGTS